MHLRCLWDTAVPAEGNGDLPTLIRVLVATLRRCLTLSNPVPLTKLNGGLSRLHSADEAAVSWLTSYGSWHTYEKKKKVACRMCICLGRPFSFVSTYFAGFLACLMVTLWKDKRKTEQRQWFLSQDCLNLPIHYNQAVSKVGDSCPGRAVWATMVHNSGFILHFKITLLSHFVIKNNHLIFTYRYIHLLFCQM